MNYIRIFTLKLIIIAAFSGTAQAQRFDTLLARLDTDYPQEKLYLHFDRSVYHPGETIWFKAYLLSSNMPSFLSTSFYAELIDDKGKVIEKRTAPLILASAAAAFDLPANLTSSVVYVRAYTRWMLNFDTSYLYSRAIPIVNPKAAKATPLPVKPLNTSLQFFPEGGDLVEGLQSRVAFKATDSRGLPVKVTGDIQDSKGTKVAELITEHNGMGTFMITPASGSQYKAVWKDSSGQAKQTNLPSAKKEGVVMEVRDVKKGIQFTIKRNESPGSPKSVFVVAQMQQQLMYRARANLTTGNIISGMIPAEDIPTGIVQVTVFSDDEKPLAERIVFVNRQNYEFITDLNAALKNVSRRGRNVIQIDVPDTIGCNLSVSVTDADINPAQNTQNDIFSHVLLTSDIKGYVHNPRYYFSGTADSISNHLDLVMMTNGWRRFKWEDVLAGKFPTIKHDPADPLSLAGKVSGLTKNQLARREISGFLELSNGSQQFINIEVQPDGSFNVPGLIFYDTAKLYYQFNNDKTKLLTSTASFYFTNGLINDPLKAKPDTSVIKYVQFPDAALIERNMEVARKSIALAEEQQKKVQTLEAVEVTGKVQSKKEKMDQDYTSGMFRGGDGYTFITDDDPFARSAISVFQYLQGKVPGLQISMAGGTPSLSWRGGQPALFLNEMMGDANMLESTPMTDVAMVKVFRPPFLGGAGGAGASGAIAVYTKKGEALKENVKGLDFARIPGYHPPKEFYSPDYSRIEPEHERQDVRTTLYWNPFVVTSKDNRRIILNFYNNDITKRFRIIVEGVDAEGKLTRIEKVFE